jgi:hypothetical protein
MARIQDFLAELTIVRSCTRPARTVHQALNSGSSTRKRRNRPERRQPRRDCFFDPKVSSPAPHTLANASNAAREEAWRSFHCRTLATRPRLERRQLEQPDRRHVRPESVEPGLVCNLPKERCQAAKFTMEASRIFNECSLAQPRPCERELRPNRVHERLPRTPVGDAGRLGRARGQSGRNLRSRMHRCVRSRGTHCPPSDQLGNSRIRRFRAAVATRSRPSQLADVRDLAEA